MVSANYVFHFVSGLAFMVLVFRLLFTERYLEFARALMNQPQRKFPTDLRVLLKNFSKVCSVELQLNSKTPILGNFSLQALIVFHQQFQISQLVLNNETGQPSLFLATKKGQMQLKESFKDSLCDQLGCKIVF